jgi:hypothetical protein
MSYARWTRDCDWYIYRQSGAAQRPEDEGLTCWHVTSGPGDPGTEFQYAEVSEMLERGDFSSIRGWSPPSNVLLQEALATFKRDVDDVYRKAPPSPGGEAQ